MEVTVLGAGAVGVCVALHLQRDGHQVRLIDRDEPGSGCSSGNAGLIQCGSVVPVASPGVVGAVPKMLLDADQPLVIRWRHMASLAPYLLRFLSEARPHRAEHNSLALGSIVPRAFEGYAPLIAAAGIQAMVKRSGELHVYETDGAFRASAPAYATRRARGVQVDELSAEEVRALEPALGSTVTRGMFMPNAYQTTNPATFIGALARHFIASGGIHVRASIDDLSVSADGSIDLVSDTALAPAKTLVVALGAFSKPWARKLGSRVTLDTERGYHVSLPSPHVAIGRLILSGEYRFAMSPVDGGIRLAGTAELATIEAPPNFARAWRLLPLARRLLPGLADGGATSWMGHRPSTPDSLPVIGPSPVHRNVFYAFGHGHSGLTLGGITGQLVADLIAGRSPAINLAPFGIARFERARQRRASVATTLSHAQGKQFG